MYKGIIIATLIQLFLSTTSVAGTLMANKTIKDVLVNLDSGVFFRTHETMDNQEGCNSNGWFQIKTNSEYKSHALSLLLAYEAQGKTINFSLNGCSSNGYPVVTYVY